MALGAVSLQSVVVVSSVGSEVVGIATGLHVVGVNAPSMRAVLAQLTGIRIMASVIDEQPVLVAVADLIDEAMHRSVTSHAVTVGTSSSLPLNAPVWQFLDLLVGFPIVEELGESFRLETPSSSLLPGFHDLRESLDSGCLPIVTP